jgi:hypothetical protein
MTYNKKDLKTYNFLFSEEKNAILKKERGISFDEIIFLIENDCLVDVIKPKNEQYKHQQMFVINVNGYIYCVPFVKNGNEIFLKTIFPSRVLSKKYL